MSSESLEHRASIAELRGAVEDAAAGCPRAAIRIDED
jgi:ferredoxin